MDEMIRVVPLAGTWIETRISTYGTWSDSVVPLAGTWIETYRRERFEHVGGVVPLAGTWIETEELPRIRSLLMSFPLRERGLKP